MFVFSQSPQDLQFLLNFISKLFVQNILTISTAIKYYGTQHYYNKLFYKNIKFTFASVSQWHCINLILPLLGDCGTYLKF